MEAVSTVISVVTCLCTPNCLDEPLGRHCKYLRGHQQLVEKLRRNMEELSARANDINRKLEEVSVQAGKEPKAEVSLWRQKVQIIENEVDSLIKKVGEEKRCLNGCFPNYWSKMNLGKQIEEKTKMVTELLNQGQFSNDQLTDLQPEIGTPLSTTTLVGKTTAERNFEKIWQYIMNDNIGKIGVYGMGGIGKTTIMKHIHNRLLKESTCFDNIIWITVSRDSNLEKLQNDIGKRLDLDFRNYEDEISRASQLLAALNRRKRFMLIVDDMWKAFLLENIGIPNPSRKNRCKVVLTTRLQGVCRGMETQKNVEIRVLSEEEAWDLFKDKVGGVLLSSNIEALAKDVAKECDGLPLALITVGRALRQVDDVMEWKNALNELRASIADIEGLEDEVFKSLKFSYTRLKNGQLRACFLYCALYPEDYNIRTGELVEHWIGEGLIDDLEWREDQICKGRTILNELKNACLLENAQDFREKECVKMHDLIRDLAIRIQCSTCMIKAGSGFTKAPRDEEWIEEVKSVSLMRSNLQHLKGEPKCPKLSSLLLQLNPLRDISPLFFQHMYNLRVVNLSCTDIEFLPQSFVDLENLRVLLLHQFVKLRTLPSVANLKSLRTLDLSDSSIKELPPGMEMLVNLKRLDLSDCKLKMFPTKLLQKLTLLQELSIKDGIFRWGSNAIEEAKGKTSAEELTSTTHLRNLVVHFKKSENFHTYIGSGHWRQLTRFTISVGFAASDKLMEFGKNYILTGGQKFIVGRMCLVLPDSTHVLDMRICDITRLSMCLSNSAQLKDCSILHCSEMECIVMAGENNLPCLEIMELNDLPKLSCLYKGVVAPGTLSCLKILLVYRCHNMKNLLTPKLLQHLQSLQKIEVSNCCKMEEIVGQEDDDKETSEGISGTNSGDGNSIITLPTLQTLGLFSLQELKSICRGVMVCNSLDTIEVKECENLKKLPIISMENGETLAPPALRKVIGNKKWWAPLKCDHPDADTFVQPIGESAL